MNYDMTPMYAMHNALRREVEHLAKATARMGDDPRRVLAAAVGWELFKKALHVHHTTEDDALWPPMREALASRPGDLALLEAMEAEHAAIDPIIEAVDKGTDPIGDLADALATALNAHLEHEEREALPLIDATVTPEQWQNFGRLHGSRIGPDAPRLFPWILDGVDEKTAAVLLAPLPEPVRGAFESEWRPAYEALTRWPAC
ncbi:hemerythrin domain-containing protein [Actinomadura formosensis]|uniref:hemerythrin domain-containing protein n=1 Tax=Actinomadura formosensis TaxID=60706 RepID=UPI000A59BC68|nr:hemerythrin domain-containing protein [Actinomadura formosensis]